MERRAQSWPTAVVGPSRHLLDWMAARDGTSRIAVVIPYFTAAHVDDLERPLAADRPVGPLTELVFFGRLEERKGVRCSRGHQPVGCRARAGLTVTFLGRPAHFHAGRCSSCPPRCASASPTSRSMTTSTKPHAREYLRQPGRLAVIPSLLDNSPNVVYECIEDRVPFLASAAGGTGELVHADDAERRCSSSRRCRRWPSGSALSSTSAGCRAGATGVRRAASLAAWASLSRRTMPRIVP